MLKYLPKARQENEPPEKYFFRIPNAHHDSGVDECGWMRGRRTRQGLFGKRSFREPGRASICRGWPQNTRERAESQHQLQLSPRLRAVPKFQFKSLRYARSIVDVNARLG